MTISKAVEIKCKGSSTLPLDQLKVFQGNLKSLSKENYQKLKSEILTEGFSSPFYVWKYTKNYELINYILSGHQRFLTLKQMQSEGIKLPTEFPIVEIEANDEGEAATKLLGYVSQYGTIDSDGLNQFIHDKQVNYKDLETRFQLPDFNTPKFKQEFFEEPKDQKEKKQKTCPHCGEVI